MVRHAPSKESCSAQVQRLLRACALHDNGGNDFFEAVPRNKPNRYVASIRYTIQKPGR